MCITSVTNTAHARCDPACSILSVAHRTRTAIFFKSEIIRHGPRGDERPQGLPIPVRRIDPRHTTVKFEPRFEPNQESRSLPTYPKKYTVQTGNYQGSRSRNASPFFLRLFPPEIGAEGVGGVFGVFDFSDSSSFK